MDQHLLDVQHVGIFVMQIEQVDLMAQRRAVIGALLDHHVVKATSRKPWEKASTVEARTEPNVLSPQTISELIRSICKCAIGGAPKNAEARSL